MNKTSFGKQICLLFLIMLTISLNAQTVNKVLQEKWNGSGKLLSELDWNQTPASSSYIDSFSITANTGNNYGARLTAEVTVPTTGVFIFYIVSDDEGDLKMSLDGTEANLMTIANVITHSHGTTNWTYTTSQKSNTYNLTAGQKILISARVKEAAGDDYLSIGWSIDGGAITIIPGSACNAPAAGPVTPEEVVDPLEAVVLYEKWDNSSNTSLSNFDFTSTPESTSNLTMFDIPVNIGDKYVTRMTAIVKAPKSGSYTFYCAADDNAKLSISTDGIMANVAEIAECTSHSGGQLNWTKYASQKSITFNLVAGQSIAIELTHRENHSLDYASAGWSVDNGPINIILGKYDEWLTSDNLEVNTPITSQVSPAWVEGRVGVVANTVTVTVDGGTAFDANLMGDTRFYANNSSSALGIDLNPTAATAVSITNSTNTVNQSITWTPTDIATGGSILIRKGDSLLLTANGTGTTVEIDTDWDSSSFTIVHTGTPAQNFVQQFNTPGTFLLQAKIDGVIVGTYTVSVADLSLDGPIACEIGYEREKAVTLIGVSVDMVSFTSSYNYNLAVNVKAWTSAGLVINIEPLSSGNDSVIARINGNSGPALAVQEVEEFDLTTQATVYITVIEQYADGSHLVQTNLEMLPQIDGIQVDLHIFVSGVTFDDATLDKTIMTDDFVNGLYPYQLIANAGINTGTCHTIKVYQNNVQIGE